MDNSPILLKQWSRLNLVSTRGTSLNIRGSANVELELEGERFTTEVVVVSPLTCEGILDLDFLQEQQATVDMRTKKLLLRKRGHQLTFMEPSRKPRQDYTKIPACAVTTVEVPPQSEIEIMARLGSPVEGVKISASQSPSHVPSWNQLPLPS